ncbi:MAG TPA: protocatechuate 3,4-dioxygenase subunit alpha [Casimicrobiaceae bacterium]|nr:protocatechuate 3,4-dioxygenase subunit alpha [Casimicrobiaceae bacterium]
MSLLATSNQTVGPYVHIGFAKLYRDDLAGGSGAGERVHLTGRIVDGDGKPMSDGIVEIWQADGNGRYAHPESSGSASEFKGFGRVPTDRDGRFRFTTIKPGRVPVPGGALQAPHISVMIFSRGLLRHLSTRMYFPDEPSNAQDPILRLVPKDRRATLIATRGGEGLEWNVVLQGADETVFFDF